MTIKNTTRSIRDCARYIESARRRYRLTKREQNNDLPCEACGTPIRVETLTVSPQSIDEQPNRITCNDCEEYRAISPDFNEVQECI